MGTAPVDPVSRGRKGEPYRRRLRYARGIRRLFHKVGVVLVEEPGALFIRGIGQL